MSNQLVWETSLEFGFVALNPNPTKPTKSNKLITNITIEDYVNDNN